MTTEAEILMGRVYRETDPRYERHVRVVDLNDLKVFVRTCDASGADKPWARTTRVDRARFLTAFELVSQ